MLLSFEEEDDDKLLAAATGPLLLGGMLFEAVGLPGRRGGGGRFAV